jgi:hypothetical protein
VARHDYHDITGWPGQITGWARQCGLFVNYDGQNDIFQNDIALDSGDTNWDTGEVWGALWSEHNDSAIDNSIKFEGSLALNISGGATWQDSKQSGVHTFINDASWNTQGGLNIGPLIQGGVLDGLTYPTTSVSHMTMVDVRTNMGSVYGTMWGIGVDGGTEPLTSYKSQIVSNNIFQSAYNFGVGNYVNSDSNYFYEDGANYGTSYYLGYVPAAGANDVVANPQLKYLTREEPGTPVYGTASDGGNVGATILYQIGTTGTLWGDPGYDTTTSTSLWPFPNEAVIKTDMASFSMTNPIAGGTISGARGFAAPGTGLYGGPITLTSYVWEALGYPCPAGICQ